MKTKRESSLLESDNKPFGVEEDFALDNLVQVIHKLHKRSPGFWSKLKSFGKNLFNNVVQGHGLNLDTIAKSALPVLAKSNSHKNYMTQSSDDEQDSNNPDDKSTEYERK
ncbi:hypothetical protein PV327_010848 [Microctonus hyperodae]|uniref:Uncharacterized protein n=1 Tax=Microctonus hyperodae TaxID=165561 RepID=A0AA39C8D0_MICHY|nr:hypothetical protein PV327_010848 [Microctonus hyperodae]